MQRQFYFLGWHNNALLLFLSERVNSLAKKSPRKPPTSHLSLGGPGLRRCDGRRCLASSVEKILDKPPTSRLSLVASSFGRFGGRRGLASSLKKGPRQKEKRKPQAGRLGALRRTLRSRFVLQKKPPLIRRPRKPQTSSLGGGGLVWEVSADVAEKAPAKPRQAV